MKNRRSEISFLLIILIVVVSCSQDPAQKRAKYMERGDGYFEKQEYNKAVIEYKNAIQAEPNFARGHYQLGLVYLKMSQPQLAFQELSKAVDIDPSNLDAQIKLGQFFLLAKQTETAREKATMVL